MKSYFESTSRNSWQTRKAKQQSSIRILNRNKESQNDRKSNPVKFNEQGWGNEELRAYGNDYPVVQAKLKIGGVNSPYEREADRIADQVVGKNTQSSGAGNLTVQKQAESTFPENEKLQGKVQPSPQIQRYAQPSPAFESNLRNLKGGGEALPSPVKSEMESSIGADFSGVSIHHNAQADELSRSINAQAFTSGNDVFFAKGKYDTGSKSGKKLLAHELVHTVQQGESPGLVQRQPSGNYKLPSGVARSVREIQAVVGVNPDGDYGNKTRKAVENYQKVLKAKGHYAGAANGEWDLATDVAHAKHAAGGDGPGWDMAMDYNCSGLAFKTFRPMWKPETLTALSSMTKLSGPGDKCKPYQYKFWFWEYDVSMTEVATGRVVSPPKPDFHIVGGRTGRNGNDPADVMSKNGNRPVKGPASPLSWTPVTDYPRTNDKNDTVMTAYMKHRKNIKLSCYCSDKLPT